MNILILFSQPWRVGGAETHVQALIKGLADDNIILAVNRGSNIEKLEKLRQKFANLQVVEIQARGMNLVQWIADIMKLSGMIKDRHIDIVSAQQRTAGIWAYILYKFGGTPFVVTMHDPWHRSFFRSIYAKLFTAMIVVSKNLRDLLIDKFSFKEEQITFINNGIDFTAFRPQNKRVLRKKLGINVNETLILHVSRLSSVKGAVALALLDSMNTVLQENKETKLVIIGEGPLREEVEQKARQFNQTHQDAVEVRNFTDRIEDWYNAADLVVGEGRVAIEALACERPVVAIRNGNYFFGAVTAENIAKAVAVNFDGTSLTVTPKNLAAEIRTASMVSEPECESIARFICSRLGIAEMTKKYHDLFVTLMKRNAS